MTLVGPTFNTFGSGHLSSLWAEVLDLVKYSTTGKLSLKVIRILAFLKQVILIDQKIGKSTDTTLVIPQQTMGSERQTAALLLIDNREGKGREEGMQNSFEYSMML